MQVRNSLNNVPGLSDVSVLSMKKMEVRLSFKFRGDSEHLHDALSRVNMSLGQGYPNGSVHKFTNNQRSAPEMIYDLMYRGAPRIKSNSFYNGAESVPNNGNAGTVHTF